MLPNCLNLLWHNVRQHMQVTVKLDEGRGRVVKAVIFDMDGTLVDSERLGRKACAMAAERLGFEGVTDQVIYSFIGRTRPDVLATLTDVLGNAQDAQRVFFLSREIRHGELGDQLELKPGAIECLEALRAAGVACGVATSTFRDLAEPTLERMGLLGYFNHVTCGGDVENGKPAPDIFLRAMELEGVDPAECAVVEDSPNGVRAGFASGASVYLVPDLIGPSQEILGMCRRVLGGLAELPAALAI